MDVAVFQGDCLCKCKELGEPCVAAVVLVRSAKLQCFLMSSIARGLVTTTEMTWSYARIPSLAAAAIFPPPSGRNEFTLVAGNILTVADRSRIVGTANYNFQVDTPGQDGLQLNLRYAQATGLFDVQFKLFQVIKTVYLNPDAALSSLLFRVQPTSALSWASLGSAPLQYGFINTNGIQQAVEVNLRTSGVPSNTNLNCTVRPNLVECNQAVSVAHMHTPFSSITLALPVAGQHFITLDESMPSTTQVTIMVGSTSGVCCTRPSEGEE